MKKKIRFGLLCALWHVIGYVVAQSSEDNFYYTEFDGGSPTTTHRDIIKSQVTNPNDSVLKKILHIFNLDQYITNASALEYIRFIINTLLSLTSLVALIIIIYGFAQVLFATDDTAISTARKTIQGAAIAITILAMSWFLVSFLFSIYESVKGI